MKMRTHLVVPGLLAASTLVLWACGTTSDPGFTQCGDFDTCQPGQYCDDPTFGDCLSGCLSNVNCSDDQTCIKDAGTDVGTCQNNAAGPVCGNGTCEGGEDASSCAADCGGSGEVCGNGTCGSGENTSNCPADCGGGEICGDGVCTGAETETSCPADCAVWEFACKDICDSYDFFDCFAPGGLQDCRDLCAAATDAQREQFWNCAEETSCNDDECLPYIGG